MTLDPPTIRRLSSRIVKLLESKCISLNDNDVDWRALFADAQHDLESCRTPDQLERCVSRVLEQSRLSHVAFFHRTATQVPARYAICATFMEADTSEGRRWMFQDVHDGGPAHSAGVRPGDALLAVDGAAAEPPVPPRFRLGEDAVLTILSREGASRSVTVLLPKAEPTRNGKGTPPMAQPTAVTARMLDGGVGYVRVAFFPGASGQPFARSLDGALTTLAASNRLIIDLRGNLGGFVGALRLMSYLTPARVPIGYSLTRLGVSRRLRPEQLPCLDRIPASTTDKLAMLLRFKVLHRDRSIRLVTEGLGPQLFHGRIVMLINEHTASAAEMVAGFAAERRLATLVGSRTAGQVLGGANFAVGQNFTLRLPAAAWYTWGGRMIEGCGVEASRTVVVNPQALSDGADPQLLTALDTVATL
jgi:C-terminal processing protease CtpA/Prc